MKRLYTLLCVALIAFAAMAQTGHRASIKNMPRLNPTATLPQRKAAPLKAGGQVLPINTTDPVVLYTNEAFSQPGHYDYYFSFANSDDEFYFPMIFFDLYLPDYEKLAEGTYTMADGTVDPNLMLMANYTDYIYYYYGYAAYEWADATISLTKGEGDDVWTVDFSATTTDDFTFSFTYTGVLTIEIDDYDPSLEEEEEEEETTYAYEPDEVSNLEVVFGVPEVYTNQLSTEGFLDIYLDTPEPNAQGLFTEAELCLYTNSATPKADIYPVNYSGAADTFLSSKGGSTTSSKDYPCFIRNYDNTYIYNSWYVVAGQITLSYDADGQMALEGNVASYNGTNIHFVTSNATGINTVIANSREVEAKKVLRDGQLHISSNGTYYNALGQRETPKE